MSHAGAADGMTARSYPALVARAVEAVREQRVLAYPTETVYGLGADAASDVAVGRLAAWKGRDAAQPLSILVPAADALDALGLALPAPARRLAEAFWPGPLTLVLASRGRFARGVARGDGAVGVRCSSHPLAAALAAGLLAEGLTITSTSLNRSGEPPARTRAEAAEALRAAGAEGPVLVDDATAPEPGGVPSTVVDASGEEPRLLRAGAVAREALARALGRPIGDAA